MLRDPRIGHKLEKMAEQLTVKGKVEIRGIGLHSGKPVRLEILPADPNSGIVFKRTDLPNSEPIAARIQNVIPSDLCTTIGLNEECRVATIEHLMAALHGLGIDNCIIKIDGPEVPILDGSAAPFVAKILAVGTDKQKAWKKFFVLKKSFEIAENGKCIKAEPSEIFQVRGEIEFDSKVIGFQEHKSTLDFAGFQDFANARTFCHIRDVDAMRRAGLALGGSLENAVVITDSSILNTEGLRHSNEFVRHKILDLVGDLYLLGSPLIASVFARRAGHNFHARFVRELLQNKDAYLATVEGIPVSPIIDEHVTRLKYKYQHP